MTTQIKLNLPDVLPKWATDSGTTLEPSTGRKELGWEVDDKPPARFWNWMWNNQYKWLKVFLSSLVKGFYKLGNSTVEADVVAYNPNVRTFVKATSAGVVSVSLDGKGVYWDDVYTDANLNPCDWCLTPGGFVIAGSFSAGNGRIAYSTDGGASWTNDTSTGVSSVGSDPCITSNYPGTNCLIVSLDGGTTLKAVYGTPGAWTVATSIGAASIYPKGLCWGLGDVYYVLGFASSGSFFKKSADAGATWTDSASAPTSTADAIYAKGCLACDTDSGRLVAATFQTAASNGRPVLWYSNDEGDTWTGATMLGALTTDPSDNSSNVRGIHFLGNGIFIAVGKFPMEQGGFVPALVSLDSGLTWGSAQVSDSYTASVESFMSGTCTGFSFVASSDLSGMHSTTPIDEVPP